MTAINRELPHPKEIYITEFPVRLYSETKI